MTLAEANRQYQRALEDRRATRTALEGVVSGERELEAAELACEMAEQEATRAWLQAGYER